MGYFTVRFVVPHNDLCKICRYEEEIKPIQHYLCEYAALWRKWLKFLENDFAEPLPGYHNVPVQHPK